MSHRFLVSFFLSKKVELVALVRVFDSRGFVPPHVGVILYTFEPFEKFHQSSSSESSIPPFSCIHLLLSSFWLCMDVRNLDGVISSSLDD